MISDYTISRIISKYKKSGSNTSDREECVNFIILNLSPKPQRQHRENRIGKRLKEKQSSSRRGGGGGVKRSFEQPQYKSKYTKIDSSSSIRSNSNSSSSQDSSKKSSENESSSNSKRKKITWP